MHCTEAVAESMVRAYSETKISLDDFLELLTPRQTELKVAPSLVFLAGLVVHDDETKAKKRFTTRQQALFSKLQQIYNDSNASDTAHRCPFTLSPALLPSPMARLEIQARVVEFEKELTKESNAVFQTLFQDENVMKTNGNKKRGGGMKKKKSKAVLKEKTTTEEASMDDGHDDDDSNKVGTKGMNAALSYVGGSRNEANDFSTLDSEDDDSFLNEEDFLVAALSSDVSLPTSLSRQQETDDATTVLLTPIQVAATNANDITQDKDSSWKQVKSKRKVRKAETKLSEEHETTMTRRQDENDASLQENEATALSDLNANESQHDNEEEAGNQHFDSVSESSLLTEKAVVPTETIASAQLHTERQSPISSNETQVQSIATNTDTMATTSTRSIPTHFEQDFLQTTIQSLQQQVQQLQAQLAQHELLLTQERQAHSKVLQQHEERMQALQLKCYISETRGRAFEEALEQHNAAVANTVTPRKFSNETDAPFDVSTGDRTTAATITTNKPLYSRATSQNLNHTNN
jgi:hypothetical protein